MNATKIEWVKNPDGTQGYTWNVITGCLNGCPYCYARRLANGRLKPLYLANTNIAIPVDLDETQRKMLELPALQDPFYPRFWEERIPKDKYITFKQIDRVREKPKGIFVCVSGNTGISLADGNTKQIKDIRIGDAVIGFANGKAKTNNVTAIKKTSSLELYRLQVNGRELVGSPNHPVLTLLGYKRLDKLSPGEYICMYEHTQKVDSKNPQMCGSPGEIIRDNNGISGGNNRWRGDNILQEDETWLFPPNFGNSEFGRVAYQLAKSDILAEAYRGSEWLWGALFEGASNRFRDCSLFRGDRAFLGKQEIAVSASKKVYPSQDIATLERTAFTRDGRDIQRCSDAQFSWHRLTSIERIRKTEILYDITTTSHNFIANGIVAHNCDMGELFGDWLPRKWQEQIFRVIKFNPWHRFYLLTKQPQNLIKFSPFSPNCWVGVTATNREQYLTATGWRGLDGIRASVKYISFEPLLESIQPSEYRLKAVNWVIIGACTGSQKELLALAESIAFKQGKTVSDFSLIPYGKQWTLQPKIEWVEEIVRACDEAGVPVFLKDNLAPALEVRKPFIETTKDYTRYPRQEEPG